MKNCRVCSVVYPSLLLCKQSQPRAAEIDLNNLPPQLDKVAFVHSVLSSLFHRRKRTVVTHPPQKTYCRHTSTTENIL